MPDGSVRRDYSLVGDQAKFAVEHGLANAQWYASPIQRERLKALMKRSDGPAIRDTIIWFAAFAITGGGGYLLWGTWWAVPAFLAYGVLYGSSTDSRWHECGHGTAFKTPWMNEVDLSDRLLHGAARADCLALEPCAAPHRHDHRRPRPRDRGVRDRPTCCDCS